MAIEDPSTYAEWYWKNSVEAVNLRAEDIEKSLSPVLAKISDGFLDIEGIPEEIIDLLTILKSPNEPSWDENLVGYAGAVLSKITDFAFNGKLRDLDYGLNDKLQNLIISPDVANLLYIRKKIPENVWKQRMTYAGYSKDEGTLFYESQKPYPSMPDLISWARYEGNPLDPQGMVLDKFDISIGDYPIWEWLSRMKLTTEQVQTLLKRQVITTFEAEQEFSRIGWQGLDAQHVKSMSYSVPNAMVMAQGNLMRGATQEQILESISIGDIHPMYAQTYLDAILVKPANIDLVRYELRKDPSLSGLGEQLKRVGVHPDFVDVYKTLAYDIPPVNDIITMAVREAFTPSIAARFGQYEDLPQDYVDAVQKKGISKEWAERYWAAHWSLPSPQQGFEMLHRGVIGEGDLNMLLRALDVMPFWRDKLTQIAYRPLSRVDVRRMFKLGILDVSGVRKAYTDIGYNDYNAQLMTDFTIEYTKGTPRKLSTTDIVTAYKKHLIEQGELQNLLSQAGLETKDIQPIIRTAQQKRIWEDQQDKIDVIEYSFKKGKFDNSKTVTELQALQLTDSYITDLIEQWTVKSVIEKDTLWTTAQTLGFMKAKVITETRARQELTDLGYDKEHIDVYIKTTPTQKA